MKANADLRAATAACQELQEMQKNGTDTTALLQNDGDDSDSCSISSDDSTASEQDPDADDTLEAKTAAKVLAIRTPTASASTGRKPKASSKPKASPKPASKTKAAKARASKARAKPSASPKPRASAAKSKAGKPVPAESFSATLKNQKRALEPAGDDACFDIKLQILILDA